MVDIIFLTIFSAAMCVTAYYWFEKYYDLKESVEENDDFEKLMRRQLELDAARLKAQEDLLREACRSWAEDPEEEEE